MFNLVPDHPVATDAPFQHLTQLMITTAMMMRMVVVTLTIMMTMLVMMVMMMLITIMMMVTPDAADEGTALALRVDRPSEKPLFAVGPR